MFPQFFKVDAGRVPFAEITLNQRGATKDEYRIDIETVAPGKDVEPTSKYEDLFCLGSIVQWWDGLPPGLRQDIEGSGAQPGCIAKARRIFNHHAQIPFVKGERA